MENFEGHAVFDILAIQNYSIHSVFEGDSMKHFVFHKLISNVIFEIFESKCSGTNKVRNSGLGPDPDISAKSGPELVTRSGFFWDAPGMT